MILGELLSVSHNNVGKVTILGAPPEIFLNDGDYLFDALSLVESLILPYAGSVILSKGQKVGFDLFVICIHIFNF